MRNKASTAELLDVSPDEIKPNPDNPRLIFRADQMELLQKSIREVGIKVPLTVYRDGTHFRLLDGERRWQCALKLNLKTVPVIVQPKPDRLENILMMFNIHHVRVDWHPLATALKLRDVQKLLQKDRKPHGLKDLAAFTGIRLSGVKRFFDFLELPQKYQDILLEEAKKPEDLQKYSADLFLEIFKAYHGIERHQPEVAKEVTQEAFVDAMVKKYDAKVIKNVVAFRQISKIARGSAPGADKTRAAPVLRRLVSQPELKIETAYNESVGAAYERRENLTRVRTLTERLNRVSGKVRGDAEFRAALEQLRDAITRLLG